jgi:hypothetical protein
MSQTNQYTDYALSRGLEGRGCLDQKMHQDAYDVTNGGASNAIAMVRMLNDMLPHVLVGPVRAQDFVPFRLVLDQLNVIVFGTNVASLADYQANADALEAYKVAAAA